MNGALANRSSRPAKQWQQLLANDNQTAGLHIVFFLQAASGFLAKRLEDGGVGGESPFIAKDQEQ